jgi:acetylornithine aminotransferase/acetylornithine/N-succinyldiaminopimelate aminotransferase
VQPDVATIAKPLAAGLPLGAILMTNRVASSMHPGMHGTTFGGGPLACAVAIEFLRVLDELQNHIREIGGYFHERLEQLKTRHGCIREVRGMGLMLGLELDSAETAKAVVSILLRNKILINRTHETVLRFLPPYIIREKHVDEVIRALDSALTSAASKQRRAARDTKNQVHTKESK